MTRRLVSAARPPGRGWLCLCAILLPFAATLAAQETDPSAGCFDCHADDTLTLPLDDGEEMPLFVDAATVAGSVHGGQLVCTDCHQGYDLDHPSGKSFASRRAYVTAAAGVCKECHFETYTLNLGSVHFEALERGSEEVPTCSDCHGAHDIHDPDQKQAMLSRSCARCHGDVFDRYARSVHGKALAEEGNDEVPACADCHTAHRVERPRSPSFRIGSPDACIRCHGNEELAAKYGLSTEVAASYLADFHGVTAALVRGPRRAEVADRQVVVVCADCHGVHDIESPSQMADEQMKARVAGVCAGCHPGAATDFPAAWLSHYPPSLRHAPLVFLIDLAYQIFIPFMVVGLGLQVVLHLYRVAIRR
jgi:Zn-finger protein